MRAPSIGNMLGFVPYSLSIGLDLLDDFDLGEAHQPDRLAVPRRLSDELPEQVRVIHLVPADGDQRHQPRSGIALLQSDLAAAKLIFSDPGIQVHISLPSLELLSLRQSEGAVDAQLPPDPRVDGPVLNLQSAARTMADAVVLHLQLALVCIRYQGELQ